MSDESDDVDIRTFLMLFGTVFMALLVVVGMFSYTDVMGEGWGQHACEEEYGPNAEYVGETSAFGGSGICNVDGEQKYVDVEWKGVLPP